MSRLFWTQEKLTFANQSLFSMWSATHLRDLFFNTYLLFLLAVEGETLHRLNWDPHLQVKPSWLLCPTLSLQVITTHKLISNYLISRGRPHVVMATARLNHNETTVMPISSQSTVVLFFFKLSCWFLFAPSLNRCSSFCTFFLLRGPTKLVWMLNAAYAISRKCCNFDNHSYN